MCTYADADYIYSRCTKETGDKHKVQIRAYYLCDKGLETRAHCSDATHSSDVLLGSSRTLGDCPSCVEGIVGKTVGSCRARESKNKR